MKSLLEIIITALPEFVFFVIKVIKKNKKNG